MLPTDEDEKEPPVPQLANDIVATEGTPADQMPPAPPSDRGADTDPNIPFLTGQQVASMMGNMTNFVEYCRGLTRLDLQSGDWEDVSWLKLCPNLTSINFGDNPELDLDTIPHLPKLKKLNLEACDVEDLGFLWKFTRTLEQLILGGNTELDCDTIPYGLVKLWRLEIPSTGTAAQDLSGLEALVALKTLRLDDNPLIDMATMPPLPCLKELSLMSCNVVELGSLAQYAATLESILLVDNVHLDFTTFPPLMSRIRHLDLESCGLEDMSHLRHYTTTLRELELNENDINPMSVPNALRYLVPLLFLNFPNPRG